MTAATDSGTLPSMSDPTLLYDVVAVNMDTRRVTALYAERKTLRNAEAIVTMAVMRRGVDEEFYAEVPSGSLKMGDTYVTP